MKTVVDRIATQAVETQLVGRLRDLLSPARIIQMKPELVGKIAAEEVDVQEVVSALVIYGS